MVLAIIPAFIILGGLYFVVLQAKGGAEEALTGAMDLLTRQTTIQLDGNTWFLQQFGLVRTMAVWVMMPLIVIAIIHAIAKGSMSDLLKCALVYPVVSLLGTMVALKVVELLLQITDDFSLVFINSVQGDVHAFFETVRASLSVNGTDYGKQFIVLILSVLLMFAALVTFVMLIVREASVYLATAFLPLAFAMLAWGVARQQAKTHVQFLLGMIIAKIPMCAVLAVAVASLAATGAMNTTATGPAQQGTIALPVSTDNISTWLTNILFAIVLLFMTGATPGAVTKMLGNFGFSGEVAAAIGGFQQRPRLKSAFLGVRRQFLIAATFKNIHKEKQDLRAARRQNRGRRLPHEMLANTGANRARGADPNRPQRSDWYIGDEEVRAIDDMVAGGSLRLNGTWGSARLNGTVIQDMSRSTNANDVAMAHAIKRAANGGGELNVNTADRTMIKYTGTTRGPGGAVTRNATATSVANIVNNATGLPLNRINVRQETQRIARLNTTLQADRTLSNRSIVSLTGAANNTQGKAMLRLQREAARIERRSSRASRPTIRVIGRPPQHASYSPPVGVVDGTH